MLQFNYGTEANEDFGSRWKIIKEQEGLFNKIIEEFFFFQKETWKSELEMKKKYPNLFLDLGTNLNQT
jgi:hypothetical protein